MLEELLLATWHRIDQYANNWIECDHGRLKARLRPMRGLKQDRNAAVIVAAHAFVQNVRRGHYELATGEPENRRLTVAFDELAWRSDPEARSPFDHAPTRSNATAPAEPYGQAVQASVVEAVQPAVDGALVAAELGDLADLGAVPAQATMRARSRKLAGAWRA